VGIILSGLIFGLVGWAVMDICLKHKIHNYEEFLQNIMGKKPAVWMNIIVTVFLFVLFATMLSAGGAALEQAFEWPVSVGIVLLGLLCLAIFLFDLEGLMKINMVCVPPLIAGGIFIGVYSFLHQEAVPAFLYFQEANWLASAVSYTSYNIITAIVLLAGMARVVNTKQVACWGGILGGLAIAVTAVFMSLPLFAGFPSNADTSIPLLNIAQQLDEVFQYGFLLLFFVAVFTSALCNGFAFLQSVCAGIPSGRLLAAKILTTATGMAAAHIGFSVFVTRVYPLFGLLGLVQIVLIFKAISNP